MKRAPFCALLIGLWSVHATGFADPADATEAAHPDARAQIDFILDNPLPESEYAESDRCVFPNTYRSVEILDGKHLLFWSQRRGVAWLNQLRYECIGLRKDAILVFDMRGRSLCDMDSFQGSPRYGGMAIAMSTHCMLGHFETISEDQAAALRIALERQAQTPAPTPKTPDAE
jgi:hypothetical protein